MAKFEAPGIVGEFRRFEWKMMLESKVLGPVSRKPRKVFGSLKPFLDHLYLKTEKCISLKLLA